MKYICIFAACLVIITSIVQFLYATNTVTFKDKFRSCQSAHLEKHSNIKSKLQCVLLCKQNSNCKAVNFHKATRRCEILQSVSNQYMKMTCDMEGWVYMELYYGQSCSHKQKENSCEKRVEPCNMTAGTFKMQTVCAETNINHMITCDNDQKLEIIHGHYGRSSQSYIVCGTSQSISNTNECLTTNSMQVLRNECQNKEECDLKIVKDKIRLFGLECQGSNVYLQVVYRCRQNPVLCEPPLSMKTATVCEGNNVDITCQSGHAIQTLYSSYGRSSRDPDLCIHPGITSYSGGNDDKCHSDSSFPQVSERCDGKKTCIFTPTNDMFGDPCGGKKKYLEMSYFCKKTINKTE